MRHALALVFALTTAPAFAADLAVGSRVDAVTVYPDGATVTRILDFEAPAGDTTLVASDFPVGLDPASIRLDASAAPGVSVAGVDARQVFPEQPAPDAGLDRQVQDLKDRRAGVEGEIAALLVKQGFIERIAKSAVIGGGKGPDDKPFDPAALRAAWNTVGDDLKDVNEALRQAGLRARAIDEDIARATARSDGRPQGQQRMELRIALGAGEAVHGRIAVSYRIDDAGWTPLYDARLDSTKGALELVRRARITQSTGEDWTDVALTVSTARATAGASVPKLETKLVTLYQPPIAVGEAAPPPADAMAPMPRKAMRPAAPAAATPLPKPGREQEAKLDTGGFQSSWTLPARTSIASGPATKALRLASTTIAPDIVARTAPALQATAYLEARFDHAEDTPLFPGPVSVYRDGLYAGQADMPLATRGEPIRLGFGADDRIKVDRVVTRKLETDSGLIRSTRSDRRDFKISLRNGRPTPIKVSVEEALPVSEIADVKVEMSPQTTPPTTKNADDRRGIMVWTYDLPAGGTQEIKFGYKVSWPGDLDVELD
ncbi:mucoidy inhibitor MuiA family protein [Labrys wisconsinensis]|uniref:Uncharacterized protein (TIGR02231 family) n=1 Tax=Labrys wisconsinensis TaxID=425677 RepID=A0ABU0JAD1_9HYPH|nr:mucoidy inhibitor MuiA family protein [Labrys wisconsinensis]MDQ0471221.1 uncharacterized protein (TIGR02231 family) [Labrys wisconsinensis]